MTGNWLPDGKKYKALFMYCPGVDEIAHGSGCFSYNFNEIPFEEMDNTDYKSFILNLCENFIGDTVIMMRDRRACYKSNLKSMKKLHLVTVDMDDVIRWYVGNIHKLHKGMKLTRQYEVPSWVSEYELTVAICDHCIVRRDSTLQYGTNNFLKITANEEPFYCQVFVKNSDIHIAIEESANYDTQRQRDVSLYPIDNPTEVFEYAVRRLFGSYIIERYSKGDKIMISAGNSEWRLSFENFKHANQFHYIRSHWNGYSFATDYSENKKPEDDYKDKEKDLKVIFLRHENGIWSDPDKHQLGLRPYTDYVLSFDREPRMQYWSKFDYRMKYSKVIKALNLDDVVKEPAMVCFSNFAKNGDPKYSFTFRYYDFRDSEPYAFEFNMNAIEVYNDPITTRTPFRCREDFEHHQFMHDYQDFVYNDDLSVTCKRKSDNEMIVLGHFIPNPRATKEQLEEFWK